MATTWGSGEGSGYGVFYVGIDFSIGSNGRTVTVRYYVRTEANSVSDTQKLTYGGKITGSTTFTMNTPNMSAQLVATKSFTGTPGSSYTVSASLSGTYSGGTPSHSRTISVPALKPSTPGTPSVSSITDDAMTLSWSHPSNNGSTLIEYHIQVDNNSSFSSPVRSFDGVTGTSERVTGLLANTTQYARIRVRNAVGWSNWSGSRSFKTKAAAPSAPTGVSVSRNSDTSHTISWNRTATSAAPYTTQYLQRWDNVSNTWAARATISGSYSSSGSQSYTDTTTVAGRRYRYRVRAQNSAAYSSYGTSNYISTTPAPPTNVVAAKSGANIVITWDIPSSTGGSNGPGSNVEVWHATDGVWDGSALTVLSGLPTSYTHLSVNNAVTHTYRLKIQAKKDSPDLYSAYSTASNTVQLLAAPNAPTPLSPADGSVVVDGGNDTAVLTWRHNPVDTTAQTKYELQYRPSDDPTWVSEGTITSGVSSHELTGLDHSKVWLWRVRTWGEYANPGPFNSSQTFTISERPSVYWTVPEDGTVLPIASISGEWYYADPEGTDQTAWQAELWLDGSRVELKTGTGTDNTVSMDTALQNGVEYELRIRAQDSAPLWSDWSSTFFTTDFAKPGGAELRGDYVTDNGTMSITISNQAIPGAPDTIYNELWVSEDPVIEVLYEAWEAAVAEAGPTTEYSWLEIRNASPSIEKINEVITRTNVLKRPLPTEESDWQTSDPALYSSLVEEGSGPDGRPAVKLERLTSSLSNLLADCYAIGSTGTNTTTQISEVLPGVEYTASVYMKCSIAAWRSWLYIYWYDATGTLISNPDTGWVEQVGTDWTRAVLTATAPTGAAFARLRAFSGTMGSNALGGELTWLADAQLEESPIATPFFSGDSVNSETEAVTNSLAALEDAWSDTATLLATELDLDTTYVYTLPRLGVDSYYRVITASDLPSYTEGPITPLMAGPVRGWLFLNGGVGFAQYAKLRAELKISRSQSREKALNRYKGRPLPVRTTGEAVTHKISVTAKIRPTHRPEPSSSADDVIELALLPGDMYLRDPLGHKWLISVETVDPEYYGLYEGVSFSGQEVEAQ